MGEYNLSLDVPKSILETEKNPKNFLSGANIFKKKQKKTKKNRFFSNPALWPIAQWACSLRPAPTTTGSMVSSRMIASHPGLRQVLGKQKNQFI
jgi:hypothetical protein